MKTNISATIREGLLLVGHGTRDSRGCEEFLLAVRQIAAACPELHVEPCFLERAAPTIREAVRSMYAAGVRRLRVMPLLLFSAGHAKNDIPDAVAGAAAKFPELELAPQLPALGCHPAILWLSELRHRQALCGEPAVPVEETLLVMIGRGSNDPTATAEMSRFAALRQERTPVGRVEVGFLAMAKPTLSDALKTATESGYLRIVVQPHLLFHGELVDKVRAAVAEVARQPSVCRTAKEWIVTPHLGPGRPLVRAVLELIRQAESTSK